MISGWVVRNSDLKKLIEDSIPQLMQDLEGSSYEQFCTLTGDKVGWRQLLSERMHLHRPSTQPKSYLRRIHQIFADDYQVIEVNIADAICLSLGVTLEDIMETYPKTITSCIERIKVEYELRGEKVSEKKAVAEARIRFAKYKKEMYPTGKVMSAHQERDKKYRTIYRAKRKKEKAA